MQSKQKNYNSPKNDSKRVTAGTSWPRSFDKLWAASGIHISLFIVQGKIVESEQLWGAVANWSNLHKFMTEAKKKWIRDQTFDVIWADGDDSVEAVAAEIVRRPTVSWPMFRARPKSATFCEAWDQSGWAKQANQIQNPICATFTVQLASTKRFSAFKSRCKMGGDALQKKD